MSDLQHKELAIECGALLGVSITSDNERRVKVTSFNFTEKQLNAFADKIENQAKEANQLEIERLREALEKIKSEQGMYEQEYQTEAYYIADSALYNPKANNET
jgi:type II secretory pathway component PulL